MRSWDRIRSLCSIEEDMVWRFTLRLGYWRSVLDCVKSLDLILPLPLGDRRIIHNDVFPVSRVRSRKMQSIMDYEPLTAEFSSDSPSPHYLLSFVSIFSISPVRSRVKFKEIGKFYNFSPKVPETSLESWKDMNISLRISIDSDRNLSSCIIS